MCNLNCVHVCVCGLSNTTPYSACNMWVDLTSRHILWAMCFTQGIKAACIALTCTINKRKPTDESSNMLKLIANPESGLVHDGNTAAASVFATADVVSLAGGVVIGCRSDGRVEEAGNGSQHILHVHQQQLGHVCVDRVPQS